MTTTVPFAAFFEAVYGYTPYRWQEDIAHRIIDGRPPRTIGVDTGMGKSKIVAAWLWALAMSGSPRRVPLRMHFVIDRRTVVDQIVVDGSALQHALRTSDDPRVVPVADALARFSPALLDVITLRGGMPTIPEHTRDLTCPTLAVSTVDMFGSRLLGRGYGVSHGRRPIDMALTGTDTLIVLDEVHLAPQLVQTLTDLDIQQALDETEIGVPGRTVVQMSATTAPGSGDALTVDWDAEFAANPGLFDRRTNRAGVSITVDMERRVDDLIMGALPEHGQAAVVFVNTVKEAIRVSAVLARTKRQVVTLVGGMPEPARAQVAQTLAPFMTGAEGRENAPATIVVATQTLEVGADIDFDYGFTEACAIDAFTQRLGRVNRLGLRAGGSITMSTGELPGDPNKDTDPADKLNPVYGRAAYETAHLLTETSDLRDLDATMKRLADTQREPLYRARPAVRRLPRHIFEQLTGDTGETLAPPVGPWLRVPEQESPTLRLAFREALALDVDEPSIIQHIQQFPVAGWETWELTPSAAAASALKLPKKDTRVLTAGTDGALEWCTFDDAPDGALVILPARPAPGVLPLFAVDLTRYRCRGEAPMILIPTLDEDEEVTVAELAERHGDGMFDEPGYSAPRAQQLGDTIVVWAARQRTAAEQRERVTLASHSADVAAAAATTALTLGLPHRLVQTVALAAERHDLGKKDPRFQDMLSAVTSANSFRFDAAPEPLAKSGSHPALDAAVRAAAAVPAGFRHEALSVTLSDQLGYPDDVSADLARYLIATHHGHFRSIPPVTADASAVIIDGVPVRNDLQDASTEQWATWHDTVDGLTQVYGPYTLALLCAIVRLADWAESATRNPA